MFPTISSDDAAPSKTSRRQKVAYKSTVVCTPKDVSQECDTRTAEKIEMKQVFRKDPPIVFDAPTIRHCNASQPNSSESQMREPARAGAMRAFEIRSVGVPC